MSLTGCGTPGFGSYRPKRCWPSTARMLLGLAAPLLRPASGALDHAGPATSLEAIAVPTSVLNQVPSGPARLDHADVRAGSRLLSVSVVKDPHHFPPRPGSPAPESSPSHPQNPIGLRSTHPLFAPNHTSERSRAPTTLQAAPTTTERSVGRRHPGAGLGRPASVCCAIEPDGSGLMGWYPPGARAKEAADSPEAHLPRPG